jgi:DNA-binding NarL/FixJ family response regulator
MPGAAATEGPGGVAERPRSVLIAEGHPVYRELVRHACEDGSGLRVAAEFEDASGAVGWWERHPADLPDIVALDLTLPGADAMELARRLLEDAPDTAVLALADAVEDRTVLECIRAGIAGLVERSGGVGRLSASLAAVASGVSGYEPAQERAALRQLGRVAKQARESSDVASTITPRELQVLGLISEGLSTRQVASRLNLSPKTVETHIAKLYRKLGARTRVQALSRAVALGLIDLG